MIATADGDTEAANDLSRRGMPDTGASVGARRDQGLAAIGSIPVSLQIVLGSANMSIAELARIDRGAIVKLDRRLGEPVDILINGRAIGRGEIIVVEDGEPCFAIAVTHLSDSATAQDQ